MQSMIFLVAFLLVSFSFQIFLKTKLGAVTTNHKCPRAHKNYKSQLSVLPRKRPITDFAFHIPKRCLVRQQPRIKLCPNKIQISD